MLVLLAVGLAAALAAASASASASAAAPGGAPLLTPPPLVESPTGYTKLRASGTKGSALYRIDLPHSHTNTKNGNGNGNGNDATTSYATPPLVLDLHGTRREIGFDYAALLHAQSDEVYASFVGSVYPGARDAALLGMFTDYLWESFLSKHTPPAFLAELEGMRDWHAANPHVRVNMTADKVASRFYTLANLPADPQNIIAMLEQELEQGWPQWLKVVVNEIIKLLERLVFSCDSYGVWGSRTENNLLFTSRNLDFNSDTGMNENKLVTFYHIDDPAFGGKPKGGVYASFGFAFGLGALAGQSQAGITTSEMNLDNSRVTFSGVPFPLRLRYVLEQATNLETAMTTWNATNNTNSFNFLIGSAPDAEKIRQEMKTNPAKAKTMSAAYALETMMDFTGEFPANSPIEAAATYYCKDAKACHKWTNETGHVKIGFPLPEAVWRSNHGMNPVIMETQEPLFNNTVFRYNLMHDIFDRLGKAKVPIDDEMAVRIVGTLGIKGPNYLTCDQKFHGDNILSVAYAPGTRDGTAKSKNGIAYVAWESGYHATWRPAGCSPYVKIDFDHWIQ